jgi:hypothetical protein
MRYLNGYLVTTLTIILLISCSKKEVITFDFEPGAALTIVNGDTIYAEAFEETYINMLTRTGYADSEKRRYFHLNQLIDEYLLAQEARRQGLLDSLTAVYTDRTINRTLRNVFVKYEFLSQLEQPDENRVRFAFYRSKQKPYVRQLYFTDETTADDYYRRLEKGESFMDLANERYATVSYDSLAGFVGEISYFGVDDVFAETAYSLDAGEYSRPVRTRQGYVIIYVENWKLNPIITETEFQQRSESIRFMLHQRDFQMGADSFIRAYMSGLNPKPVLENAQLLQRYLYQRLPQKVNPKEIERPVPTDFIKDINNLDLQAPLVTFTKEGQTFVFRMQDYLNWIDSLPFEEITTRFDGSLGRALMWNTFALESKTKGYDRDPFVNFNARVAENLFLASRLRDSLSIAPPQEIRPEDIQDAYIAFGYDSQRLESLDYLVIEVESFDSARVLQRKLLSGEININNSELTSKKSENATTIRTSELQSHLVRAEIGFPHIVGTKSGWFLMQVTSRAFRIQTIQEVTSEIEKQLKPIYNEFSLLNRLREAGTIVIDTVAFEALMNY